MAKKATPDADIYIVVGAQKVQTLSQISTDLRDIAKKISEDDKKRPSVILGVNEKQTTTQFKTNIKNVLKELQTQKLIPPIQLSVGSIDVSNIDVSPLVKKIETALSKIKISPTVHPNISADIYGGSISGGGSSSRVDKAALTRELHAEYQKLILDSYNAQVAIQDELSELLGNIQKYTRESALRGLQQIKEIYEDPFAWVKDLSPADKKYIGTQKNRLEQSTWEAKAAKMRHDELKESLKYNNSWDNIQAAVQGLAKGTEEFKLKNPPVTFTPYTEDTVEQIQQAAVEVPKAINNVQNAVAQETQSLQNSNKALQQHQDEMREAISLESQKAAQSDITADAIEQEAKSVQQDNNALAVHANQLKNINNAGGLGGGSKEAELEAIKRLAQTQLGAGYEIKSISVDKVIEDDDINNVSRLVGTVTEYNKATGESIKQTFEATRAQDEEKISIDNLILTHQKYRKLFEKKRDSITPDQWEELAQSRIDAINQRIASYKLLDRDSVVNGIAAKWVDGESIVRSKEDFDQLSVAIRTVEARLNAVAQSVKSNNSLDPLVTLSNKLNKLPTTLEQVKRSLNGLSNTTVTIGDETVDLSAKYDDLLQRLNAIRDIEPNDFTSANRQEVQNLENEAGLLQQQITLQRRSENASRLAMTPEKYTQNYKSMLASFEQIESRYNKLLTKSPALQSDFDKLRDAVRGIASEWDGATESAEHLAATTKKIKVVNKEIGAQRTSDAEQIQKFLNDISKYEKQISALENSLKISGTGVDPKYTEQLKKLSDQFVKARTLSDKYQTASDNKDINPNKLKEYGATAVAAAKDLEILSKSTRQAFNQLSSTQNAEKSINIVTNKIRALVNAMKNFESSNGKFRTDSGLSTRFDEVLAEANKHLNGSIRLNEVDYNRLREQFGAIQTDAKNFGLAGETYFQRLNSQIQKLSTYLSGATLLFGAINQIKIMTTNVINLDTAMTELRKVTDETEATYNRFLDNAITRAKDLGATLTDVITASADFARLGYNISDAAALADAAIIYKNVGDGIESISDASASIISTMKAFDVEAQDVMTIVDKFNEVGNNFSISSRGIGDALLRSASSLATAGNTIDESIALITAMNEVVQDPDVVGTSLKTISARLRSTKGELEELGEDAEGAAESITSLQTKLLNLTGGKVNILMPDGETFKSTYQILTDLSQAWQHMTDVQQAQVTELVGQIRQANTFASVMNNMSTAADVVATSMNSAGSAIAENDKYLESIQGRISLLQSSLEALSNTIIHGNLLKGGIDGLRTILDLLNSIASVSDTGLLAGLAGGILSTNGFNLIDIKKLQTALNNTTSDTQGDFWSSLLKSSFLRIGQNKSDITAIEQVIKDIEKLPKISTSILTGESTAVEFNKQLNEVSDSLLKNINISEEARVNINKYLTDLGNTQDINKATNGLKAYQTQLSATGSAAKRIGAQIANIGTQMLIGFAIGTAIDLVVQGINYLATANERAIETSKELTSAWKEQADVLSEAQDFVKQYGKELELLSRGISEHGENVSLTDDQYQRYIDLSAEALSYFPSLETMYTAQGELILKTRDAQAALNDELERANKNQRATIESDISQVYKGTIKDYNNIARERNLLQSLLTSDDIVETVEYYLSRDATGWVLDKFKEYGLKGKGLFGLGTIESWGESAEQNKSALQARLDTINQSINIAPIQQAINSIIDANDEFSKLSPELQNNIRSIFQNLDITFYTERWNANEGRQLYNDLRDKYIAPLTQFQDEIDFILNPDRTLGTEDYTKALRDSFNALPTELQDVFQTSFDENSLGFGWKKQLADKLQVDLDSISQNEYTVDELEVILNPEFSVKNGQSIDEAIAEYLAPSGTDSQEAINDAIDEYNKKIAELNLLYAEQASGQLISGDTYDYLTKKSRDLIQVLEAEYDTVSGTMTGWKLADSAVQSYIDTLRETAMETLTASGATSQQIAHLSLYKGTLSDVESQIESLNSANDELAEAFVRAANAEQFTYSEVTQLTKLYPELVFEFDNLTGKYNLYPNSVDKVIDANYAQIQSLQRTRLEWIKLKAELDFEKAGVGVGTVNTIISNINRNSITSLDDYMRTNGLDTITAHAESLVEAYTAYLNDMADADEKYASIKNALIADAQSAYKKQTQSEAEKISQYELNKAQLDREKQALDNRITLQADYIKYGIQSERDYYNTLRQIAIDGYDAQEIDAEEFKNTMVDIQVGLRNAIINEYQQRENQLTVEKQKLQAGMAYDSSVITSVEDFWDKYEALNQQRYEQNLIDATEYANAMIEVFQGRQEQLLSVFDKLDNQISLWQKQDEDSIYGYVNRDKIIDAYKQQMQIAHDLAEQYRVDMSEAGYSADEIENSDYVKNLTNIWWEANNAIKEALRDAYDEGINAYEDYIRQHNSLAMWGADSEIAAWQRAMEFLQQSYNQGLIDYRTYLNEKLSLLESQYAAEQDRQQAYFNAVRDQLAKEKAELEKIRESYEQQQSDYETVVSTVTDFIQEQIDALNKENEELDRQLNLQKAIEAVERARSQRTSRIYREGEGFVWEADESAVKDAEENLSDLEREYALQDRIDALEEYKKAWQATIDSYEDNINREIVASKLGANWEQYLLDMRTDYLEDFAHEYADIRNQLDENFDGSIANQISSIDEMSEAWNSMYDDINDELNNYIGLAEYMAEFEQMSYEERLDALAAFKESAVANLQAIRAAAQEASNALASIGSTNPSGTDSSGVPYKRPNLSTEEQNIIDSMKYNAGKWHQATDSEKEGLHNANQQLSDLLASYGTSMEYDPVSGIWYIIKNGQKFRAFASGGLSTERGLAMLHGSQTNPEVILNNSDASKLWHFVQKTLPQSLNSDNIGIRSIPQITIGDIYLHGVQDVNGLSKAIVERLPLRIMQLTQK